jgi:hypothetical protein
MTNESDARNVSNAFIGFFINIVRETRGFADKYKFDFGRYINVVGLKNLTYTNQFKPRNGVNHRFS